MLPRSLTVFCLTLCAACALGRAPIVLLADEGAALAEHPTPIAKLNELRPVVRDGWYNAFTDLTRWKGYYWLGYRRGTYHNQVRGNTDAVVMRSNDLVRWRQAKVFECPDGIADGCGTSRPAFAPTDERLYAFLPVQTPLEGGLRGRVYVTWTGDGLSWSPLRLTTAGEHHPYLYRVRHHDGKFYSTRHVPEIIPGAKAGDFDLVVSEDGVSWKKHARIAHGLAQGGFSEESDLCWLADGELWCVVRASYGARFFRSRPPYTRWSRGLNIGKCDAPVLCVQGGQVYLAGRGRGGYQGTTVLSHLTRSGARRILTFPAGGDASYPGMVALEEPDTWIREVQGQLVLSFYSDVAYHSGELKPRYFPEYRYKYSANDIFVAEVGLQHTGSDAPAIQIVESDAGFQFKEGEKDVLFYQRAPKSLDGEFTRSNYVHPLHDLAGNVMTEDFPADHRHHRGIFWAWHQVRVGDRSIGDSWWARDFSWDVVDASVVTGSDSSSLTVDVLWKSPDWTDESGKQKPLVKERTTIRVHGAKNDTRRIDFEIRLLALEKNLRIGGSEDDKGYGGFSTRVRLPEDVRFQRRGGEATPQRTAVDGGPWIDIVGTFGKARWPSGMAILCHPSLPGFPQGWLLRSSGSMQNPVYPGREPVLLSTKEPLVLRYRLVLHRGRVDRETIDRWQAEYARHHAAEPTYSVKVVTDRENALYEVGEEVTFLISVTDDGKPVTRGTVSYVVDDFLMGGKAAGLPEGTARLNESPVQLTVTGRRPEFLRCQVTFAPTDGKPSRAIAAAGFSPEKIGLSLPVPDDFDEYWAEQKRELARFPPEPKLTPLEHADESVECFDVQVKCLGGAPVSGYFASPKTVRPRSLPAILWVHGAGVGSSNLDNAVQGARSGFLSMDINAHGLPNGKPDSFYAEKSSGPLKGYPHAGRESRDTTYFRGMYLRLVRAIDFLTSRPGWDGKHVAVVGHSQGGGQSLVAGGIDDRVTFIAPGVPAICDHSGQAAGRVNGWPALVPNGADGKPDPESLEAARYVDAVNFASRCKADAIMSVGFIDATCPPSSCYAAYNALEGNKTVINEPLMGHEAPAHIHRAFFDRILEHVGKGGR